MFLVDFQQIFNGPGLQDSAATLHFHSFFSKGKEWRKNMKTAICSAEPLPLPVLKGFASGNTRKEQHKHTLVWVAIWNQSQIPLQPSTAPGEVGNGQGFRQEATKKRNLEDFAYSCMCRTLLLCTLKVTGQLRFYQERSSSQWSWWLGPYSQDKRSKARVGGNLRKRGKSTIGVSILVGVSDVSLAI